MATSQTQSNNLAEEIKKLEQQLAEKTALLNKQQFEKIQSNLESPYNSEATTILKEVFN